MPTVAYSILESFLGISIDSHVADWLYMYKCSLEGVVLVYKGSTSKQQLSRFGHGRQEHLPRAPRLGHGRGGSHGGPPSPRQHLSLSLS